MAKQYYYSILRLTPDPIRRESLNVGVVLVGEQGDFADVRRTRRFRDRLTALAPDAAANALERYVDDFEEQFRASSQEEGGSGAKLRPTPDDLARLADNFAYQLEVTTPRPVSSENPGFTLDELFDEFVRLRRQPPRENLTRPKIRGRVRHALHEWGVPSDAVTEDVEVPVRHGRNRLNIGVMRGDNGQDLAVAIEPISFQLQQQDGILRQRDHVAWVARDLAPTDTPLTICAVVSKPTPQNEDLFAESLQLLDNFHVESVQVEDVRPLRTLLAKSGVAVD